jgi:4,5:9,10-diseco-3-hydroxy-5,9,17-trioxoandrosta-1(10),2-diene-4-oate hydrolase
MTRARWLIVGLVLLAGLTLTDRPRTPRPPHQAELLQAGDARVRALRAGAGDTTLVLLHGYGEHLLTWRGVVDPLATRYRVVAIDLPGFGASEKPDAPYTLPAMASRIEDFLGRWTRPPVVLAGHSMGGAIAAQVALDRPDLVQGLILIAPAGLRIGLGPITDDVTPARAGAIGIWEAARAFLTPLHDPEWLREPPGLEDYNPTADPAFRRSTGRALMEFDFVGIGTKLSGIRQPVLLLWGRRDPIIPWQVGRDIANLLPCNKFVTINGALHRPQFERPDTVASLILAFLAEPRCDSRTEDWPKSLPR